MAPYPRQFGPPEDVEERTQGLRIRSPLLGFLAFNAGVEFHIAMTPDDLQKASLEELGKKWF